MALAALIWRGASLPPASSIGKQDVVRVGAHDALDRMRLEVALLASAFRCRTTAVPRRTRSACSAVAGATSKPAPPDERHTQASLAPGPAARHLDPVGDHEGGIEADAELADQAGAVLGLGETAHEGARARARDGAEIVDQLLAIHADAVVGNGERAGLGYPASMRMASGRRRPSAPGLAIAS